MGSWGGGRRSGWREGQAVAGPRFDPASATLGAVASREIERGSACGADDSLARLAVPFQSSCWWAEPYPDRNNSGAKAPFHSCRLIPRPEGPWLLPPSCCAGREVWASAKLVPLEKKAIAKRIGRATCRHTLIKAFSFQSSFDRLGLLTEQSRDGCTQFRFIFKSLPHSVSEFRHY